MIDRLQKCLEKEGFGFSIKAINKSAAESKVDLGQAIFSKQIARQSDSHL